jgi:hypothetical protein
VALYVDQHVGPDTHRCFGTDLSPTGLYMERPLSDASLARGCREVQLEVPLPDGPSVWALGEVVYDRVDGLFHGQAVRFKAMARGDRAALERFLFEARRAPYRPFARFATAGARSLRAAAGASDAGVTIVRPARRA